MTDRPGFDLNWIDKLVAHVAPGRGVQRAVQRHQLRTLAATGYDGADSGRKRKFHRNTKSGDALSRAAAPALRNQVRHLERNYDVVSGALDKLVDFTIGPSGVAVEPQPKRRNGDVHDEFAAQLRAEYEEWSKWPEVTWTHNRAALERLAARTWYRDGEGLGQIVSGPRADLEYGSAIPVAIEALEPDLLPHFYDDPAKNIRQGIERNTWGRPTRYHFLRDHPGDEYRTMSLRTKPVAAERVLHVRHVNRFHQLRGVTLFAPVIPRFQDAHEYENNEQAAAKLASSLVVQYTRGAPEMWGDSQLGGSTQYDPNNPPVMKFDGGMVVVNGNPGEKVEVFDSKRPNTGATPWLAQQMRFASAGIGLSYSALSRDYNGTYSAQRQELVENWPHYHALTGIFTAQWVQPTYEEFVRWRVLTKGMSADVDPGSVFDAQFFGPAMPWIDPEKEANANLILVQACFKSSSQVIRQLGNNLPDTYRQLGVERRLRQSEQLSSTVDVSADLVSPAKPSAPESPKSPSSRVVPIRRLDEVEPA